MGYLNNHFLHAIKKKFPEQGERIEELYLLDEDFRTLCADYLLCMRELQKSYKEAGEKKLSIEEYKNVRVALEDEFSHFLFKA